MTPLKKPRPIVFGFNKVIGAQYKDVGDLKADKYLFLYTSADLKSYVGARGKPVTIGKEFYRVASVEERKITPYFAIALLGIGYMSEDIQHALGLHELRSRK